jgi:outer membrane biosynthesis protein TonB
VKVASFLLLALMLTGCETVTEIASPAPAPPPTRSSPVAPSALPAPTPAPPPAQEPSPPAPAPRVLSPEVADEPRMRREAQSRIEGAERLARQIDEKKLGGEQQQSFQTIQSFVAKAKEALSTGDLQRAFTLADKAYLLANELSRSLSSR